MLLHLAHDGKIVGHPGRTRMFTRLRRTYYWPLMAADIAATVRSCPHCANNRLLLIRNKQKMRLFPATKPLEQVSVDLLGPLPRTRAGHRFILVIADRFTKLTQVVPLRRSTGLDVAKAFASHWVIKYGAPKEVLSDNGPQFASKLYQNTCLVMGRKHLHFGVPPPNERPSRALQPIDLRDAPMLYLRSSSELG